MGVIQIIPITVAEVVETSLIKLVGSSGYVMMTAPLPSSDDSPSPTTLIAVTLA
jgi:hypothetical protein